MLRFVIGRDDDCDVVISAPSISRRHAYASLSRNGMIHFEDADSTNGSFYLEGDNLTRFKAIDLPPEARLQLGKVRVSVAEILMQILAKIVSAVGDKERQKARQQPSFRDFPTRAPR